MNSTTASLELLLEAGREHGVTGLVEARTREGQTALHFACVWECVEHAKLLLEAGADVDAQNEFGATALHWAAERRSASCCSCCWTACSDGVRLPGANTDAADDCGRTALHVATENDMLREAMMLVKNGETCGQP